MEFKQLSNDYKGYSWTTNYQTNGYYELTQAASSEHFSFEWQRKHYPNALAKSFTSELFADYLESSEAVGVFKDQTLIALIETAVESWNQRLRVTSIWLAEAHRRRGLGERLMALAVKRAQENGYRGLILKPSRLI